MKRRPTQSTRTVTLVPSTTLFRSIVLELFSRRFPFVPNDPAQLDEDCYEAFNIQVEGLARRFQAPSGNHIIIGVSGGLDSTHALIVAAKACARLGLPRSTILGFTMPGVRSQEHTSELTSLMPIPYAVFCLTKHIKRPQ